MKLWWRLRAHGSLWLILWADGRTVYRCALCGRRGVEIAG